MEREKSLEQMSWEELEAIVEVYCEKRPWQSATNDQCHGCPCKGMAACLKILPDKMDLIEAVKAIEGGKS